MVSFALALILFAIIPDSDLMLLLKMLAVAVAITLLSPFWYPHLRGVREGDIVVFASPTPFAHYGLKYGKALNSGRIGSHIMIMDEDGNEHRCRVISYAGTFSKARVVIEDEAEAKAR